MGPRLTREANVSAPQGRTGHGERGFWRLGVVVFVASAAATLMFWAVVPSRFLVNESNDYTSFYEPVARQIVAGHGVVTPDGEPALRTPPGHPLFLAAGFAFSGWAGIPEAVVLPALCVLCMGVASTILFATARSVWGSVPALVTATAWMTYPLGLWLTKQPNSEMPFLVVFCLVVFLFVRLVTRRKWSRTLSLAVGIAAGVAMLIRPIAVGSGLVMALIAMLAYVRRGSGVHHGLVVACLIITGNLLVVAPWEAWVYSRTGRLVLLQATTRGTMRAGLVLAASAQWMPENVASLAQDIEGRFNREVRSYGDVVLLLVGELRARPRAVVELLTLKIVRSWFGTDSGRYEKSILLIQIPYLALIGWSTVVALRKNRPFALTIWTLVLYFWLMTVWAFTIVRYMVPAIGLLFTLLPAVVRRSHEPAPGEGRESGPTDRRL